MKDPILLIGYVLGSAMGVIGIIVLAGFITLQGDVDPIFNTAFGAMILLFGIYRLVVTEAKRKQKEREAKG